MNNTIDEYKQLPLSKKIYKALASPEESMNIGFSNFVLKHRVVAIIEPNSLPMKRLIEKACMENHVVDATRGRKTRSIILLDSDHFILSTLTPQTLIERFQQKINKSYEDIEKEYGELIT